MSYAVLRPYKRIGLLWIPRSADTIYLGALTLAVLIGLLVRLSFVRMASFPLNDGGLFYAMVRDLQRNAYSLPMYASYNSEHIPFAYPPLGFYLVGIISDVTHWSLISIFRFFPLTMNVLMILAFIRLSRLLLASRRAVVFSTFAFVLLPRSFEWLIMGGGVTRSLGGLFSILALHHVYLLYKTNRRRELIPAIIFCGLTLVSHPEWSWFLFYSIALFFVLFGRHRCGVTNAVFLAIGTALVAAPWWLTIISRFGLAPFLSATHDGWPWYGGLVSIALLQLSDEPFFHLIEAIAFLGMARSIVKREFFLPLWCASIFLLDPRSALTASVVPLALLAGIGLNEVVLPMLRRPIDSEGFQPSPTGSGSPSRCEESRFDALTQIVLLCILAYATFAAEVAWRPQLAPLSRKERTAMAWVARNTPRDSTFLVMTDQTWTVDKASEWFPVLSHRSSVATVQGTEWVGKGIFGRRIAQSVSLATCATAGSSCLERWSLKANASFDYVFIPKVRQEYDFSTSTVDPFASLRRSLGRDRIFVRIYDGPGATIYRRVRSNT